MEVILTALKSFIYKTAIIGSGIYCELTKCLCSDSNIYLKNCKFSVSVVFKTLIQEDGAGGLGCLRVMLQALVRGCGDCSLCLGLDMSLKRAFPCLSSHLVRRDQESHAEERRL